MDANKDQVDQHLNRHVEAGNPVGILLHPEISFYQYPPPEPIAISEIPFLSEKLALDRPMPRQTFSIFISVPYCRSQCHSCLFFKDILPSYANKFAQLNEYLTYIGIQATRFAMTTRFSSAQCGAIYFGGGTASLLDPNQIGHILNIIRDSFSLSDPPEITLEGNPLDLSLKYLEQIKKHGINRISIGIQSFQDKTLKALNSPHDGKSSLRSLSDAIASQFGTTNIDLLYQIPSQSRMNWTFDLITALNFEPENITLNEYKIFQGSAAEALIKKGLLEPPINADGAWEWYLSSKEYLEQAGYIEKRIGSFSRPNHNQRYTHLAYTEGLEILGLGAGAYSFINNHTLVNCKKADIFEDHVRKGSLLPASGLSAQATTTNLMERYIIFNLPTAARLNRKEFHNHFGQDPLIAFPSIFDNLRSYKLVDIETDEIRLTTLGRRRRSTVAYEFYSFK